MKTKTESFDDIVFENRNKNYGAYELRRKYSKRGTIALLIAFTFFGGSVAAPLIAAMMSDNKIIRFDPIPKGPNELSGVPVEPPTLPPPPPAPVDVKAIKFRTPVVVDEVKNDEEIAINEDIIEAGNPTEVDTSTYVPVTIVKDPEPEVPVIFETFAIQEKPIFGKGEKDILNYVAENTKYPVPAQEQGIQGTVYIRFVVTKTGEVDNARVMRPVDPMLEEEAMRVIKSMPKWTPGKNNGNPVNVWFIIPVKFVLN
ncbi:MAG: energy transducer TonB [Bacteroidales bacterium]